MVQFPHKRDERIIVLLSEEMGIGKSTLYDILENLFGPELIIFFNSYKEFDDGFNLQLRTLHILAGCITRFAPVWAGITKPLRGQNSCL